jgi:Ca2+-transporting ATPase
VLLGWPLVLFPVHIVFLELIIDPACSMAFEAEPDDPRLMQRPPRKAGASLFDRRLVTVAILQGASLLAATMVCFRLGLDHTGSEDSGRTLAFTTLIAGNVSLILVNRSWGRSVLATMARRNVASWAVVAGATLTLLLAFWVPFLHQLFRFGPASADDLAVAAAAGVLSLAWFEVLKLFKTSWLQAT